MGLWNLLALKITRAKNLNGQKGWDIYKDSNTLNDQNKTEIFCKETFCEVHVTPDLSTPW